MRRSVFIYILVSVGACLFFSCSRQEAQKEQTKNPRLTVLSTTGMIQDIVAQVGGGRVIAEVLIMGEIDPHSYELVKGDDEKIDSAAVIFYNGLNLEHGASLQYKIASHPNKVALGDILLHDYPDFILFEDKQIDPHIWMDISLWAKIVEPIVAALSQVDPEGKLYYEERGAIVRTKMLELHSSLKESMQEVPDSKRYLVTSHDAFGYFTRAYLATQEDLVTGKWVDRFRAPEGLAPDGQLGAIDLQQIVEYLLKYHIEVVFPESNVSRDSLRKIVQACKEKKAEVHFSSQVLYGDCMGDKNSPDGTYLGMMAHNIGVLVQAWQ